MKSDHQILKGLSNVLTALLSINNMYFLHYRMQEYWGYQELAFQARESSMTALKNSLLVMERILFLDNHPNVVHCDEIKMGRTCEEQLSYQYKNELDFSGLLRETIVFCIDQKDCASKELLDKMYQSNQKRIDWLETQFRKISDFGMLKYLSDQLEFPLRRANDTGVNSSLPRLSRTAKGPLAFSG